MPLSVQFRWKNPFIETPKSQAEKDRLNEGLSSLGNTIMSVKQSRRAEEMRRQNAARQAELDRMNAEDRQRRIDAEDRMQRIYGETADLISGKQAERQKLVAQREQIAQQIAALRQRIGM